MNVVTRLLQVPHMKEALWIAAIALCARVALLLALVSSHGYGAILLGDSTHYLMLAEHVHQGIGYVYDGVLEAYRAPGYPAFLYFFVVTGIPLIVGSVLQIVVSSAIPAATYVFARRMGLPRVLSWCAGLLLAFEPTMIFYSVVLMPDVFFAALTLVAAFYAVRWCSEYRWTHAALAGVLCGVANYFRPADLYLPFAFVIGGLLVLLYRKHLSVRAVLPLLLVPFFAFLVMAPWSLRNLYHFGTTKFVSSQAPNLYKYGAGATLANAGHRNYPDVVRELYAQAALDNPGVDINAFAMEEYLMTKSKDIIRAHPVAYIETYLVGLSGFWFSGNYHTLFARYGLISAEHRSVSYSLALAQDGVGGLIKKIIETFDTYVVIALFSKALWLTIGVLAAFGLWIYRREPSAWVAAIMFAYFSATLLSTTIGVEARHRYMLNTQLVVFAALALHTFAIWARRRRQ